MPVYSTAFYLIYAKHVFQVNTIGLGQANTRVECDGVVRLGGRIPGGLESDVERRQVEG